MVHKFWITISLQLLFLLLNLLLWHYARLMWRDSPPPNCRAVSNFIVTTVCSFLGPSLGMRIRKKEPVSHRSQSHWLLGPCKSISHCLRAPAKDTKPRGILCLEDSLATPGDQPQQLRRNTNFNNRNRCMDPGPNGFTLWQNVVKQPLYGETRAHRILLFQSSPFESFSVSSSLCREVNRSLGCYWTRRLQWCGFAAIYQTTMSIVQSPRNSTARRTLTIVRYQFIIISQQKHAVSLIGPLQLWYPGGCVGGWWLYRLKEWADG